MIAQAKNQYKGRRNRAAGLYFEQMINASCRHYREKGIAEISKTPEPMKPLGKPNTRGQFLACFTKAAQPDYKGTLKGGRAVVFEAKHTDTGKIQRSVISESQEKQLNSHLELGAMTFVLVSFGLQKFYNIPWDVFRNMKEYYGRKYLKAEDIHGFEVKYSAGYIKFLPYSER